MRRIQLGTIGTLLSLTITSCGGIEGSISSAPKWIPDEMYYQTDGHCENGDLVFKILAAGGTPLWTDPAQVLTAQSDMYLQKDGTFTVRYREFPGTSGAASYETRLSGSYVVNPENGEISFANLGQGRVIQRNGRYALDFQYNVDIHSSQLNGKKARFHLWSSLTGLDSDRAQYCGY
ncbi:hypothetical protein QJS83_15130 [Bdellovibrio sp. 22V]|uniref:hypothetical protein n=1 Tax=Bdellovibrio TaxID=958 RepID=UPI002542D460|nr:hypothetical protein [Bdellovibrio sp. 22V]WII71796.1 hypothetical protein QJS83_15130 [Bdellovibrio sp. 22V]